MVIPFLSANASFTLVYNITPHTQLEEIFLGSDGSISYDYYNAGSYNADPNNEMSIRWYNSQGSLVDDVSAGELGWNTKDRFVLDFNSEQLIIKSHTDDSIILFKSDGSEPLMFSNSNNLLGNSTVTSVWLRNDYFYTYNNIENVIRVFKLDDSLSSNSGSQGPQGIQGPQGNAGPQGPQGDKGDKGDTGDTGDTGPKGDTGEAGPQGPTGLDSSAIQTLRVSEPHIEANGDGKFDVTYSVESSENLSDWSTEFNINTTLDPEDASKQFLRLTVE